MLVKVLAGILLSLLAVWAIINVINIIITARKRKAQRNAKNTAAPQNNAAVAETDNAANNNSGAADNQDQMAEKSAFEYHKRG